PGPAPFAAGLPDARDVHGAPACERAPPDEVRVLPDPAIEELHGPLVHRLPCPLAQVREAPPHAEACRAGLEAGRRGATGEEGELVPPPRVRGPGEGLGDLLREGGAGHAR